MTPGLGLVILVTLRSVRRTGPRFFSFLNCDFKCSTLYGVPAPVTMSNFVKIGQRLQRYCDFTVFQTGVRRRPGFPEIQILNG